MILSQTFTKFFPVLPSILSKYQFHFDQLWANITSILTNFYQRLNYWGGVLQPPYSDVPVREACMVVVTPIIKSLMMKHCCCCEI
jgi:hypothetical protein